MKLLSLDTSTKYSVIALSDEGGLIYGSRRFSERGHSDGLSVLISRSLKKANIKIGTIDYFGVGVGPGSFTGLRIGISTVKGLAYALNKPCLIFSSLDAIAYNSVSYKKDQLCVMVDARRSNVYVRFYNRIASKNSVSCSIKRISEVSLMPFASLQKRIKGGLSISGDALKLYHPELDKWGDESLQFVPERFWYPTPESISFLTQESLKSGKTLDCFGLSAVYLYEQDCQVKKGC